MFRTVGPIAVLAVVIAGSAAAAPALTPPMAWLISPGEASCRIELELTGRSGAIMPVALVSDGERVALRFSKDDIPERAFLSIRVNQKAYANLMLRTADPTVGELVLSDLTQAALRKGALLQIAWLAEEPVSGSLSGAEAEIPNLKTCGAQAAGQARAHQAAVAGAKARAEAEAHAQAIAQAQLQTAQAQVATAEAERQRVALEAERLEAALDNERQQAAYGAQHRRAEEAAQQRAAYEQQRQRASDDYGNGYMRPVWEALPAWTRGGYRRAPYNGY